MEQLKGRGCLKIHLDLGPKSPLVSNLLYSTGYDCLDSNLLLTHLPHLNFQAIISYMLTLIRKPFVLHL